MAYLCVYPVMDIFFITLTNMLAKDINNFNDLMYKYEIWPVVNGDVMSGMGIGMVMKWLG